MMHAMLPGGGCTVASSSASAATSLSLALMAAPDVWQPLLTQMLAASGESSPSSRSSVATSHTHKTRLCGHHLTPFAMSTASMLCWSCRRSQGLQYCTSQWRALSHGRLLVSMRAGTSPLAAQCLWLLGQPASQALFHLDDPATRVLQHWHGWLNLKEPCYLSVEVNWSQRERLSRRISLSSVPNGITGLPRGQELNDESREREMGKLLLSMEGRQHEVLRAHGPVLSNGTQVWFSQHADLDWNERASKLALVSPDAVKLIRFESTRVTSA